jgi:hypothetical protein
MFDGMSDDQVYQTAFELIQKENDRGAALLAAMMTEHCLDLLIEKRLLPPYGKENFISGFNSPIGTFSSKIELAYRTGIIPIGLAKLLNGLRKIRNSYAHEVAGDFDNPKIASRTEETFKTNPDHYNDFIKGWSSSIQETYDKYNVDLLADAGTIKLRVRFNNYFALVVTNLNSLTRLNKQIDKIS